MYYPVDERITDSALIEFSHYPEFRTADNPQIWVALVYPRKWICVANVNLANSWGLQEAPYAFKQEQSRGS